MHHGRKLELARCLVHSSLKRKGANDFQSSSLSVFGSSATGAGKDELFKLGYAARDARADGAERDLENVRDFLIRRVIITDIGT